MIYIFEDHSLDSERRELRRGKDIVAVEPQVFDILQYLIGNRDRDVSKDNLLAKIWSGAFRADVEQPDQTPSPAW